MENYMSLNNRGYAFPRGNGRHLGQRLVAKPYYSSDTGNNGSKEYAQYMQMHSEEYVKELISAVKALIDLTSEKFEFKRDERADVVFEKVRKLADHMSEEWMIKKTAYDMAADIDRIITGLMKEQK